ncbi:MAG: Fic family protein [Fimbriimonadaceae bacterium]
MDERVSIPASSASPLRPDPRYILSDKTKAQIQTLGSARIERTPLKWEGEALNSVALTVFASSEIEGESFGAENLEPFVAALTEPGEQVNPDLKERMETFRDQVETYFWAMSQPDPLTTNFIQELHRRMFQTAKPEIAEELKRKPVHIQFRRNGDQKLIETIPPELTEEFLAALCERSNRPRPKDEAFLAAAEFHCDFLAIHPFTDGNGRTARLLASLLLERAGYHFTAIYPLDQVVLDTRRAYYDALFESQRHWHQPEEDQTPWIEYFTDTVFEQWERAMRRVQRGSIG